jgi:N-acetylglucosaminyl-diphospho-decaprenol L-rhamnosyltransferase
MQSVGVVIVTHNSESEIGACLDALRETNAEVVVVDNASADGTVAAVQGRGVNLIPNRTNRGFAAAVNQGFAAVNGDFVLVLNPDSVLQSSLKPLVEACSLPGAAGAGGLLLGRDGLPQVGFMVRGFPTVAALALESLLLNRIWPTNPANRKYRGFGLDYTRRIPVEQPAGAFLMIRRAVWEELGGFDEGFYPLWFEDVDFCRRASQRGYRLYYEPKAVAKHTGAHSISRLTVELRQIYWYRSLLRYSAKHFRPLGLRAVCLAVVTGSIVRLLVEMTSTRSLKPLAVYSKVVRLASQCLFVGWRDGGILSSPDSQ